jgi:putative phosphoesterase
MRIIVISDTHGSISDAEYAINSNKEAGMMIHLGDNYRDAVRLADKFPELRVEYVQGNCDYASEGVMKEKLLEIDGFRFFITHGHYYSVKQTYKKLYQRASELGADIVLTGHTHSPCIDSENGIILLNPGSTSNPRGSAFGSYAVLEITSNGLRPEIFYL